MLLSLAVGSCCCYHHKLSRDTVVMVVSPLLRKAYNSEFPSGKSGEEAKEENQKSKSEAKDFGTTWAQWSAEEVVLWPHTSQGVARNKLLNSYNPNELD